MRILLINYEYPPLGGGAGNATRNMAREMAALGHTVFVMTARFADLPHEETVDGYTVIRIPSRRRAKDRSNVIEMLSFLLSSLWAVIAWRRRIRADACIAYFGIPGAPAAWVQRILFGVPYIVSLRGGDVPGFQPYDLKNFHRLTKPIIQFLWWQSKSVVANSKGLATLAQKSAPNRKIHIIPNGVDTTFFSPVEKDFQGRLLFVGRVSQQKGLTYLLQAIAQSDTKPTRLTIVGDGPLRSPLENEARSLGLEDIVHLHGWADRTDLPAIYQNHDIFVLPSLDEGMPNVILEAMASGLPIICTAIAGNEELVDQQNGWVVSPQVIPALTNAVNAALTTPLTDKSKQSRQRALGYSWHSVAERYLELLHN